jgi:hypothetical protein
MKNYLLSFCTNDADTLIDPDNRQYWRCQADNYEHAVEQLKDAEPDMKWCEWVNPESE